MKTETNEFVLHDWMEKLPFQMQALLLTGIRGPDGATKHNSAKSVVRFLRGVVLKPAGELRYIMPPFFFDNDNDFMWGNYNESFESVANGFWNSHDHYPHHFIMHLLHCSQVIGYKHPDKLISAYWLAFYLQGCLSFHMNPETEKEMDLRLNDFKNEDV